ncbi:unnamed protein product [Closterium sp. NIES-54]
MASYITHNIKGLPSGYNLMCWIMAMPGVFDTRGSVGSLAEMVAEVGSRRRTLTGPTQLETVVVAAVVDGGSPESAATPTTSPSSVPTGLRQRDHKGGRGNSDGGRRRRDQPCKEKQASKKMSSANNTNSSDSNGPGNGDASCLMVSVVEPTISLAPEAIDDFNLVPATLQANPLVVLLKSRCSHNLMGVEGGLRRHGAERRREQWEAGKQVLVPYVLYVLGVQANLFLAGQLKDSGVRLQDDDDEMLLVSAVGDVHSALHRPSPLHQPSPLLDDVDIEVDGGGGSADDLVGDEVDTRHVAREAGARWRRHANPPTDSSTTTSSLLAEGSELDDEDENVQPPVPAIPPLVADMHELTTALATNDEGSLGALHVAPASDITSDRHDVKRVGEREMLSTIEEPRAVEISPTGELSANEELAGEPMSNKKSAGESTLVQRLAVDKAVFDQEGELSAGEESIESNVVEVPVEKPAPRHSGHLRKAQEQQSYHACVRLIAFTTLLDDAQADVELPEIDPDMHADPEHCWDITTMAVKGVLASWKGKAVKAAMDEEIRSLIANGTRELAEWSRGVNVMKNHWVLMTKYHVDNMVACKKARLVVMGFTHVYNVDYDKTYAPVESYAMLRIFLSIVAILNLHLLQLDMKNAFL